MIEKIDDRLVFLWHVLLGGAWFIGRPSKADSIDALNDRLCERGFSPLSDDEIKWWIDTAPDVVPWAIASPNAYGEIMSGKNTAVIARQYFIQACIFYGLSQGITFSRLELDTVLYGFQHPALSGREARVYGVYSNTPYFRDNPFDLLDFALRLTELHPCFFHHASGLSSEDMRHIRIQFIALYVLHLRLLDIDAVDYVNQNLKKVGEKPLVEAEEELVKTIVNDAVQVKVFG